MLFLVWVGVEVVVGRSDVVEGGMRVIYRVREREQRDSVSKIPRAQTRGSVSTIGKVTEKVGGMH